MEILGSRRLGVSNLIIVTTSPDTRSSGISITGCRGWSALVIATSGIPRPATTSTPTAVTSTSTRSRSSAIRSRSKSCLRATPGAAVSVSGGWGRDWTGSGSRQGAGSGRGNRAPGRGCRELFAAVGGWNEIWRAGIVGGSRSAGRVRVVRGVCGGRVGVHEGIEVRATRGFGASIPGTTIGVWGVGSAGGGIPTVVIVRYCKAGWGDYLRRGFISSIGGSTTVHTIRRRLTTGKVSRCATAIIRTQPGRSLAARAICRCTRPRKAGLRRPAAAPRRSPIRGHRGCSAISPPICTATRTHKVLVRLNSTSVKAVYRFLISDAIDDGGGGMENSLFKT